VREFADRNATLSTLAPRTRFAYTLFLVASLASYVVMVLLALQRSGTTPASIADYYAGGGERYAKTTGELLEVTHFHLFSMPLLLFVQGHVFLMTSWPKRLQYALVCAAFAGAALDLAAPWLVLAFGRELAWSKIAARVLLAPPLVLFALVPLWELWFARRPPERT
jgi:hypothetical protein